MTTDPYFSKPGNDHPFVSVGFQGGAGSGKSHTAALIGKGLHDKIKSDKPLTIFSTEPTTNFVGPILEGIDVQIKSARSLADLITTIEKCAAGASDILVVDSLTGVWEGFLSSYSNGGRNELTKQDFVRINNIWCDRVFLPLQSAPVHVIYTIREGSDYTKHLLGDKVDYTKAGTKRQAGNSFGYEPDVLVQMKVSDFQIGQQRGKSARTYKVIKGRGPDLIDGLTGTDPTYETFHKYISFVLANPIERTETESRSNDQLIAEENTVTSADKPTLIALERNRELIKSIKIDNAEENRTTMFALTKIAYGEISETAISGMTAEQHARARITLEALVDGIKLARQWESLVFQGIDIPIAPRINHLETANLAEASIDQLNAYYDFLKEKHNEKS